MLQKQKFSDNDHYDLPLIYNVNEHTVHFGRCEFCLISGFKFGWICFRNFRDGDITFRDRVFPEKLGEYVKNIDLLSLIEDEVRFTSLSDSDSIRVMVEDLEDLDDFSWGEKLWRGVGKGILKESCEDVSGPSIFHFKNRSILGNFFPRPELTMDRPKTDNKDQFELKSQFLKELQEKAFSGSDNEDANEHIEKVLEIVDLFHVSNITVDQLMLRVFPISLTGAASRWLRNEPTGGNFVYYVVGIFRHDKFLLKRCNSQTTLKMLKKAIKNGRIPLKNGIMGTQEEERLGELAHTRLTVELADRTVKYPKGIAENVLVGIGKFTFPMDFIILNMPEDIKVPLILERPFLSTAQSKIDVFKARLYGIDLVLNRLLDHFLEDYIELNALNEPVKLRRNQGDDLMPTIEEGEVIEEFRTRDEDT
ncbi:putative reverse transcriptase domain-containing protein [Tanacetum coccineum]